VGVGATRRRASTPHPPSSHLLLLSLEVALQSALQPVCSERHSDLSHERCAHSSEVSLPAGRVTGEMRDALRQFDLEGVRLLARIRNALPPTVAVAPLRPVPRMRSGARSFHLTAPAAQPGTRQCATMRLEIQVPV